MDLPLSDNTHAGVSLRYLVLYHHTRGLDQTGSSPPCLTAAIRCIRMVCSDAERPVPKTHLLGNSLIQTLTWAAGKNLKNPLHFRPLALEIFTFIGGMWFDPWVDNIPSDDRARLVDALGNVLDAPDPAHGIRDPLT